LSFYQKQIIGGIVKGLVKPSEVGLTSADFEDDLGEVFSIVAKLEGRGDSIDAGVIYQSLAERDSDLFLSVKDLETFADSVHTASQVFTVANKVKESSLKEYLIKSISNLASQNGDNSGGQILQQLQRLVSDAETDYSSHASKFVWLKDSADAQLLHFTELYEGKTNAVPTGFAKLDKEILDGFSNADEHVICGQTGSGKSALALNFALRQARNGVKVGFVSREMAIQELFTRLTSTEGQTPRWKIRKDMFEGTYNEIIQSLNNIKDLPIAFDTQTQNVEDLQIQTKQAVEQSGLQILYVDYIQLLSFK